MRIRDPNLPGFGRRMPPEPGSSLSYLRAAQAYMLISMPTDTSTIFGVFQVIRVSQVFGATFAPGRT
jgi:hypothetical protein